MNASGPHDGGREVWVLPAALDTGGMTPEDKRFDRHHHALIKCATSARPEAGRLISVTVSDGHGKADIRTAAYAARRISAPRSHSERVVAALENLRRAGHR
jgi:hypothetical protein